MQNVFKAVIFFLDGVGVLLCVDNGATVFESVAFCKFIFLLYLNNRWKHQYIFFLNISLIR